MPFRQAFDEMRQKGFIFDGYEKFILSDNKKRLAMDAAMITPANSGVPVEFTAFLDPTIVEILTATRKAREIFQEVSKGDWATEYARFTAIENTGHTQPYADYGNQGTSDVNPTFPLREQYVFQTTIRYGDLEQAKLGKTKIDLASMKQKSAANTLDIDANKFYLYGVQGKAVYGLLNEPSIPAAVASSGLWNTLTTQQIYESILDCFKSLVDNAQGHIAQDDDLILAMSPTSSVDIARATDFNVSVYDMLKKYFTKLKIVTLPELSTTGTGNNIMLIAENIEGQVTGQLGFSEKMRAHQPLRQSSSWEQKFTGTTYGCILYRPFAVSVMMGV